MDERILDDELTADGNIPKKNYLNLIGGVIRLVYFSYLVYAMFPLFLDGFQTDQNTALFWEEILVILAFLLFWSNHLIQGFRNILGMALKYSKILTSLSFLGTLLVIIRVIYSFIVNYEYITFDLLQILKLAGFILIVCIPFFLDIKLLFFKKKSF